MGTALAAEDGVAGGGGKEESGRSQEKSTKAQLGEVATVAGNP